MLSSSITTRRTSRLLFSLFAASAAIGCGRSPDAPPDPIASVGVSAPDTAVVAGESIKLSAVAVTTTGQPVSDRTVAWNSSDTTKATVSTDGLVTGRTEGVVTIAAVIELVTGTKSLRVLPTAGVSEPISARGRLLFTRDDRLATSRYDRGDIRYLTPKGLNVGLYAVSPDGNWLTFYNSPANSDLYVMKTDGTGRTKIATTTTSFFQPSWTPDNNAVVVQESAPTGDAIVIYSREGARISSFITDDALKLPRGTNQGFLRGVSGDGKWVIIWRQVGGAFGTLAHEIYAVSIDGTQSKLIGHGMRPRLTPDGTKVVSTCDGVCIVNVDGTNERKIWNEGALEPWVSPDNQRVVFSGCGGLCVTTIDGVVVSKITNLPSVGLFGVGWFPTGDGMFFSCQYVTGGGNFVSIRYDICRVNLAGNGFANITNDANYDIRPSTVETGGQAKH